MATLIPKIPCTCDDCLDPDWDVACGDDCAEPFVSYHRMAGATGCSCIEMGAQACTVFEAVTDCSCEDKPGVTHAGRKIIEARFGWSEPAETLASIVEQLCPGAPVIYKLYGSLTPLNCVTSVSGLDLLWNDTDVVAIPVTVDGDGNCVGGIFTLDAATLGISTAPTPGGTGTDCSQEGGYATYVLEVSVSCGDNTFLLCLCPFTGIVGSPFNCDGPTGYCCLFSISESVTPCNVDGGIGNVHLQVLRTPGCSCIPTTANININGTDFPLGADTTIDFPVDPCFCGVTEITITLDVIYPVWPGTCDFDCTANNQVAVIYHQFFMPCV